MAAPSSTNAGRCRSLRYPDAIPEIAQILHELLERPKSGWPADNAKMQADVQHLRLSPLAFVEQEIDRAAHVIEIGLRGAPGSPAMNLKSLLSSA